MRRLVEFSSESGEPILVEVEDVGLGGETRRGGGLTPFFLRPSTERRSLYEAHHTVVGHHGPDPVGGKRGGTSGDEDRH
jgi:hypothetical protein